MIRKTKGNLSLKILFVLTIIILGFCIYFLLTSYQVTNISKAENHVIDKTLGWSALAVSANGSIIVAGAAAAPNYSHGNLYTSKDSGKTWTILRSAGEHNWTSITCSSDCSVIAATAKDNDLTSHILISTNAGKSWIDKGNLDLVEGHDLKSITSSKDGTQLTLVSLDGVILNSQDGGITWHSIESKFLTKGNPQVIASSADGTRLAIVTSIGDIFTTSDSGRTWVDQTGAGSRDWSAIASSADGKHLIAAADNQSTGSGGIYLSSDGGATWTYQKQLGSHDWQSVASSANGKVLAALDNGNNENSDAVYISTDGKNWTKDKGIPGDGTVILQLSSNGNLLAIADGYRGSIWTIDLQTSLLDKLLKLL